MATCDVDSKAKGGGDAWEGIAIEVARIIREYGIEVFREFVQRAAREGVDAFDEKKRREKARRDFVARYGTWVASKQLKRRLKLGFFHWVETFRGKVSVPEGLNVPGRPRGKRSRKSSLWRKWIGAYRRLFKALQERGFPDEGKGGFEYSFDVEAWLPPELSPQDDPSTDDPLPVPKRPLSIAEKAAGLSAIHDAYLPGEEKIDPWATGYSTEEAAAGWKRKVCPEGNWYYFQMREAGQLDSGTVPIVQLWLTDLRKHLLGTKPGSEEARRSPDFRSVNWFGKEYSFTPNQAACVKILWEAWENRTPEVGGDHLIEGGDVQDSAQRVDLIFRACPAWGSMIVSGKTKGSYRLKGP